jgi:hypothetical protein
MAEVSPERGRPSAVLCSYTIYSTHRLHLLKAMWTPKELMQHNCRCGLSEWRIMLVRFDLRWRLGLEGVWVWSRWEGDASGDIIFKSIDHITTRKA